MKYLSTLSALLIATYLLVLLVGIVLNRVIELDMFGGAFLLVILVLFYGMGKVWWHILFLVFVAILFKQGKKRWLVVVAYFYVLVFGVIEVMLIPSKVFI
ncbi:hypothetical protein CHU32_02570 [Superficieibacter electus]|uniref:Uncharacterized protein n=1 Tax=Superficieibacter electus TaxID=2022662 RepID=A0A2P5GUU8_9ENTR|nr:hypothetical protein [Superficieibacter electus]POP44311.1 hypothetical protein CHU33_12680 [Superficieibacter electus]POP50329.1 hypothetical protein CHU32_02570 [Superficieibacter electus]